MPSPTVILHTDAPASALAILSETHSDLRVETCDSYAALPHLIEWTGAEIVYSVRFDGTPRFPRQALVESPSVRWVSVGGSGTDHLRPWDPARVTVTNAAGVAADMIAETCWARCSPFPSTCAGLSAASGRASGVPPSSSRSADAPC